MDGRPMGGQVDARMDGWMDGWKDGGDDGCVIEPPAADRAAVAAAKWNAPRHRRTVSARTWNSSSVVCLIAFRTRCDIVIDILMVIIIYFIFIE